MVGGDKAGLDRTEGLDSLDDGGTQFNSRACLLEVGEVHFIAEWEVASGEAWLGRTGRLDLLDDDGGTQVNSRTRLLLVGGFLLLLNPLVKFFSHSHTTSPSILTL